MIEESLNIDLVQENNTTKIKKKKEKKEEKLYPSHVQDLR